MYLFKIYPLNSSLYYTLQLIRLFKYRPLFNIAFYGNKTLCKSILLFLSATSRGNRYEFPIFTDEESKAQRDLQHSHSALIEKLGLDSSPGISQPWFIRLYFLKCE